MTPESLRLLDASLERHLRRSRRRAWFRSVATSLGRGLSESGMASTISGAWLRIDRDDDRDR